MPLSDAVGLRSLRGSACSGKHERQDSNRRPPQVTTCRDLSAGPRLGGITQTDRHRSRGSFLAGMEKRSWSFRSLSVMRQSPRGVAMNAFLKMAGYAPLRERRALEEMLRGG